MQSSTQKNSTSILGTSNLHRGRQPFVCVVFSIYYFLLIAYAKIEKALATCVNYDALK